MGIVHPDKDKPSGPPSERSPWVYASEGTQLAVTLLIGVYLGYKFDQWKNTLPWFTLVGAFVGIVAGLYNFLKRFLTK